MKRLSILTLTALLSACSQEPRSAQYFMEHPEDIAGVLRNCGSGAQRGGECQTAAEAETRLKVKADRERDRQFFERMGKQ